MSARILSVILAVALGGALGSGAATTTTVTRAVMVNTNGAVVSPAGFFDSNSIPVLATVTSIVSGATNGVAYWVTNIAAAKATAATGSLGSAAFRPNNSFIASTGGTATNLTVASNLGVAGTTTATRVFGTNVLYSRQGNVWPRTHRVVVSGGPASYGAAAGGGGAACYHVSYGSAFPCGTYTNIRRMAAITLTYLTNATWNAAAATNLSITLYGSAVAPGEGNWAFGTGWYPTNNGLWTFQSAGATAYITGTNVTMNVPVPLYNNGIPSAVFHPVVYVHNQGATPVTNVLVSVIYELDNGVED